MKDSDYFVRGFISESPLNEEKLYFVIPVLQHEGTTWIPTKFTWTRDDLVTATPNAQSFVRELPRTPKIGASDGDGIWFIGLELYTTLSRIDGLKQTAEMIDAWPGRLLGMRWRVGQWGDFVAFTSQLFTLAKREYYRNLTCNPDVSADAFRIIDNIHFTTEKVEQMILRALHFWEQRDWDRFNHVKTSAVARGIVGSEEDFQNRFDEVKNWLIEERIAPLTDPRELLKRAGIWLSENEAALDGREPLNLESLRTDT